MKTKNRHCALAIAAISLLGAFSSPAPVTIQVVPNSIVISPVNPMIAAGSDEVFTATGYYDGLSTNVINSTNGLVWSSSNPGVATIDTNGVAKGLTGGTTIITATLGSAITNTTLTVQNPFGAQTSFALSATYQVGSNPQSVAAFKNVDGLVDLVCANIFDDTLTLLTNDGSGIFSSNTCFNVGIQPDWVIAFTNSDGRLTLACANHGYLQERCSLTVLTNTSSGSFCLSATLTAGLNQYPESLIAADLNGDGNVSLICDSLDTLTIFTNNGVGTFSFYTNMTTSYFPNSVEAADVNGDGKLDLMFVIEPQVDAPGPVVVLTNNGTGFFTLSGNYYPTANEPISLAVADVNGDGHPDLISANFNGGNSSLTLFTNNGDGTFTIAANYPVGNGAYCVIAFTNVDGMVDLACVNDLSDTLEVLTNNGSGGFAPAWTNQVGAGTTSVIAADVNGDGKLDLICPNGGENTVTVFFNTSTFNSIPFTYTTNNGALTITGYIGTGGAVTIPATINGYPVTSIGDDAFYTGYPGLTNLTSISIPNGVTSIGNFAFDYCTMLTNVIIPNSVTGIGSGAFLYCSSLKNITIPNSVQNIPFDAFGYCSGLTNINIPGSVNIIGDSAFEHCSGLANVSLTNGLNYIGNYAFGGCSGLTSAAIPSSVTNIALAPFIACSSLTNISVNQPNDFYSSLNGVLFDKVQSSLLEFPGGLGGNYVIPNTVTNIEGMAFSSCENLTELTLGAEVASIGSSAFSGCPNLSMVYFLGNSPAPTNDLSVFAGDSSATAYYLPGATGWSSAFDGIPTQLLLPPPPALGISTYGGQPAVFFPTATGTNFVLQMTTNLNKPINWVTVTNGIPISGIVVTNVAGAIFFQLK